MIGQSVYELDLWADVDERTKVTERRPAEAND